MNYDYNVYMKKMQIMVKNKIIKTEKENNRK